MSLMSFGQQLDGSLVQEQTLLILHFLELIQWCLQLIYIFEGRIHEYCDQWVEEEGNGKNLICLSLKMGG